MNLLALDLGSRAALLRGDYRDRGAAPGWPHADSAAGLSFLDSGGQVFLVIDDDGLIAGECGTKTAAGPDGIVEICYGIAAPSRGRGLGGAAVAALLSELTRGGDLRAVEAEVHVGNIASMRLLERLGFVATGEDRGGHRRYRYATLGHSE